MADKIIIREERHRQHAMGRLSLLNLETEWEVIIKPYVKNRSLDQNALYWKWLTIIGDDLGYTKDEMHEEMMRQHLPPQLVNTPAGIVEVYSTKGLGVRVMSKYMEAISIQAADYGIPLPHPVE